MGLRSVSPARTRHSAFRMRVGLDARGLDAAHIAVFDGQRDDKNKSTRDTRNKIKSGPCPPERLHGRRTAQRKGDAYAGRTVQRDFDRRLRLRYDAAFERGSGAHLRSGVSAIESDDR